jgi:hypothetical protein
MGTYHESKDLTHDAAHLPIVPQCSILLANQVATRGPVE